MNKFIFLTFVLFFGCFFSVLSNEIDDKKLQKIFKNVRCLVCQGQSLDDSNSDFAENLKVVIKDKLETGYSEKEVYSFLQEKYGEWILLKPLFNFKNIFLWLLPYTFFIFGGILLFFIVKKNKA